MLLHQLFGVVLFLKFFEKRFAVLLVGFLVRPEVVRVVVRLAVRFAPVRLPVRPALVAVHWPFEFHEPVVFQALLFQLLLFQLPSVWNFLVVERFVPLAAFRAVVRFVRVVGVVRFVAVDWPQPLVVERVFFRVARRVVLLRALVRVFVRRPRVFERLFERLDGIFMDSCEARDQSRRRANLVSNARVAIRGGRAGLPGNTAAGITGRDLHRRTRRVK